MKRDNPFVKLKWYRRIYERRKKIMERIELEINRLESPYLGIVFRGQRNAVEIQYRYMPRERRKRCKRLRSVRHKLCKTTNKIYWEMWEIENRQCKYKGIDDFRWRLLEMEAAEAA